MKKLSYFFVFFLFFIPTSLICMQPIPVKLNCDKSHCQVSLDVIKKSIVMLEKYWYKQKLAIAKEKPIVVYNTSPQQLTAFSNAAHETEDTFPAFYKKLTDLEKENLIIAAGQSCLNSPEITALIAQEYFPKDIVTTYFIPPMEKEEVQIYLQQAIMRHNMAESNLSWKQIFLSKNKTFWSLNGISYEIPHDFNAHPYLYTTNLSHQIQLYNLNNPELTLIHMNKKVGTVEYRITSTSLDTGITYYLERIDNQNIIKTEFLLDNYILTATSSPDGKFIAICEGNDTNTSTVLLTLNHESDDIINKQINLTQNLSQLIDIQFSDISNALFILSCDDNIKKTQLLIYDLHNFQEKLIFFDGCTETFPTINHDTSRMIIYGSDALSAYDISSLSHPTLIDTIDIKQLAYETALYYNEKHNTNVSTIGYVTAVQYINKSNNAVAQLHNGNMIFIEEKSPHKISFITSINSYLYCDQSKVNLLSCLLQIPDSHFLISYSPLTVTETNLQHPYVTIWNTQSKKIVFSKEHFFSLFQYPITVLSSDDCSFIINIGKKEQKMWLTYKLFSPDEKETKDWLNKTHSLFSLYILRRLYQAHINNKEVTIEENDTLDIFLKTLPKNITQCLEKYFMLQRKNVLEIYAQTLVNNFEDTLDTCKLFLQNLGK